MNKMNAIAKFVFPKGPMGAKENVQQRVSPSPVIYLIAFFVRISCVVTNVKEKNMVYEHIIGTWPGMQLQNLGHAKPIFSVASTKKDKQPIAHLLL